MNTSTSAAPLAGGSFVQMPVDILARRDINPAAKLIYAVLSDYERIQGNGTAWPGQRTLRAKVGLTGSVVGRAIARLTSVGLVEIVEVGKGTRPTTYWLSARKTRALEPESLRPENVDASARKTRTKPEHKPEHKPEQQRATPARPAALAAPKAEAERRSRVEQKRRARQRSRESERLEAEVKRQARAILDESPDEARAAWRRIRRPYDPEDYAVLPTLVLDEMKPGETEKLRHAIQAQWARRRLVGAA